MSQIYETEAQFQRAVIEAAQRNGWSAYSVPDSRRATSSGFPDLVLAHSGHARLVFAELKTNKGRVRPEQKQWLWTLEQAGQEVYVLRPADWPLITEILTGQKERP